MLLRKSTILFNMAYVPKKKVKPVSEETSTTTEEIAAPVEAAQAAPEVDSTPAQAEEEPTPTPAPAPEPAPAPAPAPEPPRQKRDARTVVLERIAKLEQAAAEAPTLAHRESVDALLSECRHILAQI